MAGNGDMKTTAVIDIDLILGKVDEKEFVQELSAASNRVGEIISKTPVNSDLKVGVRLDNKDLDLSLRKLAEEVEGRLNLFGESLDNTDPRKGPARSFKKFFGEVKAAFSASAKDYGVEAERIYDKLAERNRRALNRLSQEDFQAVQNYASQKKLQNKLLTQVLTSSARINNEIRVGKERIPIPPILLDELESWLKREQERLRRFEEFTKERDGVFLREKERESRRYRRRTITSGLASLDTAQKDFPFRGVERALRKEISDLTKFQDQVGLDRKDAVGNRIRRRDSELRRVQEKRREVFGSTLGTSVEQAEYRSATAEARYKVARDRAKDRGLPTAERIAAETVAQRELNTARTQAYRVLEKLAPLENSKEEGDRNAFEAANQRVAALAKEVVVLKDLKDARVRASQVQDAGRSVEAQTKRAGELLDQLSGLQKGGEDYELVKLRLERALRKASKAADKIDTEETYGLVEAKKAEYRVLSGEATAAATVRRQKERKASRDAAEKQRLRDELAQAERDSQANAPYLYQVGKQTEFGVADEISRFELLAQRYGRNAGQAFNLGLEETAKRFRSLGKEVAQVAKDIKTLEASDQSPESLLARFQRGNEFDASLTRGYTADAVARWRKKFEDDNAKLQGAIGQNASGALISLATGRAETVRPARESAMAFDLPGRLSSFQSRFRALKTDLPASENDLIKFLNKVKDIRREVDKLNTEGFEGASASAKRLIDDLDILSKDARRAVKETGVEAVSKKNAEYLASVRKESERMEKEDARVRRLFDDQNAKLQPAIGQRKPLDILTAWLTGQDKVSPDLQPARLYKFQEPKPLSPADLEWGNLYALRSQFAGLGYRKGPTPSANLLGMVASDPLGIDGAVANLQILQRSLRDVARTAKDSGIKSLESEFTGLANAVGKAIKQVNQFDQAASKPAKAPTAAQARQAEKERIRQALIAEGQAAFEDVGGLKNYSQIPKEQYKPALEYAKDAEARVLNQFAAVRDDKTLDPGIKKKQLRELTVEFNQASRAAKVLQQEINGNVGALRQISLAARQFFRYFLVYGGMYQIIGYFTQMTRTLVDFQDTLKQTQVIAQATDEEMVNIGSSIRDVAKETGQSLQVVSDAAQTLAQAGVAVQNIPAALQAVSNFAMATGSSMQVASDIIASAKEIFDEDITFGGAADQLTRAINISKLRAEDLKTIFNLGAQTAQNSGLTSSQFLGASATLSNLGIKSSTVATGLRQLLLEIFNPDEKTLQFLRKRYNQLGENLTDQEIRNRFSEFEKSNSPLVAALTELRRLGAAGSAQEDFRRVLDIRAENVGLPLIRRLDDLVRNIARVSETGAAAQGADDRTDTLKKAFETLGRNAELLGETLLDLANGPLKAVATTLSEGIDRIREYTAKLGREGRSPVTGIDDAATGALGGFAVGKLFGFGKLGTTVTTIFGALADLAQAKIFEGFGKDVIGKAITILTGIFGIFSIFGKKKVVGVPPGPGAADQAVNSALGFVGVIGSLFDWLKKAFTGNVLGRLTGAVSKLLPFAGGGPIAWLTALAYTAYELYDWLTKASKQGPPNLDVRRRDVADLEKQRGEILDERKSYQDQQSEFKDAEAKAQKASDTLKELFGDKADEAVQMLAELGTVPLESSTEMAKKFKARLEQELLKGKQLSARQFSRLIEAQSSLLQVQSLVAASQDKYTRDAIKLLKDTNGKTDAAGAKVVESAEAMNRDPLFGPNGFKPETLVSKLRQLFANADYFIKKASGRLDAVNGPLEAAKVDLTTAEVQTVPEQAVDLEVSRILNDPTKEGLERLKQLRAGYRKAYIDPLENDPVRRAESGKPFDAAKAKAVDDQIAEKEKRLKQFDEQIQQAEAGVAEKDKRAEDEKKAKEDQAKADEKRKADAAKKAAEITEREAKLLDMRLRSKNLEDQWETEYAAARKAQNWDALLKDKGLIDQTTEAETQVAKAEQEIAELALRKLADEKGIIDLPSDLSKVTLDQKKLFLGDSEVRSAYESYLDKTQAVNDAVEEGRKRRRTVFEESKQIVPFSESDAYRDRDNKIRDLNTQIRRVQTQGSEEHLALERQKYDLQKAQLEEQIAHLKSQEGNYKRNEKGQGQYRAAMDDLQNKLKDLQDDYDEKVIKANKELRIKDAAARVKRAREELEYLRKQQDLVGQGPTSTRMQTIQIRGQALATTPSYPGASGYTTPYDNLFSKFEEQYRLPPGLLKAIANVETGGKFDPQAVNPTSGAQGLMQIMPAMQPRLKVRDPFDPEQSIRGGAENLKWLLGYYKGNTDKAIMAYNTSFKNVDKGKIPRETRNYLPKVKAAWQQGTASAAPVAGRMLSWDDLPYIDQDGVGGSDVIGLEKFKNTAPEVYQAIIGGAMKWVEEQGGKSKVMIRDLGRHGGRGNHKFGFAGDVQLVDKNGKVLPNIMAGGETFRNYERFWQDGVAYAMGQNPEWAKLPDYFRYGGYFLDNTPVDIMHGDITKKYNPGTPMPAGGTLAGGANRKLLSKFSNLGIISQGIPGGDWNAYRQARFGGGVAQGPGASVEVPLLSGMLPPQSDLDRIQDLTYRQERAIDELRQALLDENRAKGGGIEGERAVYEELKNEISRTDRAQQETTVDNLRSKLQQQQVALEQIQARGLRSGPADTSMRDAAGLTAAPMDAYEMLLDIEQVLLALRAQAQQNLLDAEEALKTDEGIANLLEQQLKDPTLSGQDRSIKQARLDEKLNNIKAYRAAITEFQRDINETTRGLGTNRQQQQDVNPSATGKVYEDGSRTYGQLEQAFDFKAIAGELNNLSYSLKNLGRNIRGFIVGAIDTFVSTIADKLVKGAEEVDTAALNQARADLYQARADRSLGAAQQGAELDKYNATMQGSSYDPAAVQQRREELQAARTQSIAAASERERAAQEQVKALEEQQGGGIGAALQEAFTALSQDFASTMLKTIMLAPFEKILNSITGKADGSATNPYHVVNKDGSQIGGTGSPGASGEAKEGGMFDGILKPLESIFYGIGDMFGGLFNTIMGWMGSLGGGGGGGAGWVSSLLSVVGMAFAGGGHVKGPGTGTSDSIPAWLSNGEYVLTAAEVQKIGVQNIEKWKKAMASPAKFATGGLVQTFDSVARNAANYSNANATGGGAEINIIDQRAQGTSEPVVATRSQGPDGKEMINIMVRDAVKTAINSGMLDRTMQATYGTRRVGGRR